MSPLLLSKKEKKRFYSHLSMHNSEIKVSMRRGHSPLEERERRGRNAHTRSILEAKKTRFKLKKKSFQLKQGLCVRRCSGMNNFEGHAIIA